MAFVFVPEQSLAQVFNHSSPDYLNKGVLYVQDHDLILGSVSPGSDVVVFAYVPFDEEIALTFFNKFLPKIQAKNVPIVVRPRITSAASVSVFRVAQCIQDDAKTISFINGMMRTQSIWKKQKNVFRYVIPETKKLGISDNIVAECLNDSNAFKALYDMEIYAIKQRILRKPPMPELQIFVNRHMFPGIIDRDILQNTVLRAIDKIQTHEHGANFSELEKEMPGDILLGSKSAPVKLIRYDTPEFSSLNGFINDQLPTIHEKYVKNGQLAITFRLYPWFETGNFAVKMVHCAGEKNTDVLRFAAANSHRIAGKEGFWNRKPEVEQDMARQAIKMYGLSKSDYFRCIASTQIQADIRNVMKQADNVLNYFYSPTIIINGQEYTKGLTLEEHTTIIDAALSRK